MGPVWFAAVGGSLIGKDFLHAQNDAIIIFWEIKWFEVWPMLYKKNTNIYDIK
jgi:hypothetical protein